MMKSILLLNLSVTATVASMAQDFAHNHPSITNNNADNQINNVGLRGRGLARGVKGSKPDKREPTKDSKEKAPKEKASKEKEPKEKAIKEKRTKEPLGLNEDITSVSPTVDIEGIPEVPADEIASLLPSCPPHYDPSNIAYTAGDTTEMKSHIFVCKSPPYETYCNTAEMDDGWNDTIQELWDDAWGRVGKCEIVEGDAMEDIAVMVPGEATEATEAATTTSTEAPFATTTTTEEATTTEAPITTAATSTTTTSTTTEDIMTSTAVATASATEATSEDDLISETPTNFPTYMPTEELPACPPVYDPTKSYVAGELAEVHEQTFQCSEEEGYETYCNIAEWDDALLLEHEDAKEMWSEAWVYVEPCAASTLEEVMEEEVLEEEDASS